jgi:hypothetical protein
MSDEPTRAHKRWTKEEEAKLCLWYGVQRTDTIASKLKRTPWGVDEHAAEMGLRITQGYLSLRDLVRTTGYEAAALLALAESAGIIFRRTPRTQRRKKAKRRRYAITEEQKTLIIAAINRLENPNRVPGVKGKHRPTWGKNGKSDGCLRCGRFDLPHQGRNLCQNCYTALQKRNMLHLYPKLTGDKK